MSNKENCYVNLGNENPLMADNGPLYWLAIMVCVAIFAIFGFMLREISNEMDCKRTVGISYIYDDSLCYRVVDGYPYYVDLSMEKKLKELKEELSLTD